MHNQFIIFFALLGLLIVRAEAGLFKSESEDVKLIRNFDKINEYLVQNVDSDDAEENMEKAMDWYKKESSKLMGSHSLGDALKYFTSLPELVMSTSKCLRDGSNILLLNDKALAGKVHSSSSEDYPLRRVDKIVQHYAEKFAQICSLFEDFKTENLEYAHKQAIYDEINKHLPDGSESSLETAATLLEKASKDGYLADGLKQLQALKELSSESSCNHQGYLIAFKNELAAGILAGHRRSVARNIDLIVSEAVKKHAATCKPVYREKFLTLSKQLDTETLKTVTTLANVYFGLTFNENVKNQITVELTKPAKSSDFSSQWIDWLNNRSEQEKYSAKITFIESNLLYSTIEVLTNGKYEAKFLKPVDDEVNEETVSRLYIEYLLKPCTNYVDLVGDQVFIPTDHDSTKVKEYFETEDFISQLNFIHGRASFQLCQVIIESQFLMIKKLTRKVSES